ncbi:unnamed protein product [Brachionus calyciflorus]|uniref:Uncharacterized protein n=1 Tax=Brachionus calyciflorus TaxID=104777 RepID=A0A813M5L2_9BILA|nr:unnamed protein product [Brachionus calyciflorus]
MTPVISISNSSEKFSFNQNINSIKINAIIILACIVLSILSIFLFYYQCLKKRGQLKSSISTIQNFDARENKSENEIQNKVPNKANNNDVKKSFSAQSVNSVNFEKVQIDVFNSVNSQILAQQFTNNFINKKIEDSTDNIYFTDLRHLSKNGMYIIAPLNEKNNQVKEVNDKIDKKRKSGFKTIKNLNKKIKKFIEIHRENNRKEIDDVFCLFNMSPMQQKYFLDFYGSDKNPILVARQDYKKKLKRKKMNSSKRESFNSDLDNCTEVLNDQIRSYLNNAELTRVQPHHDQSGGLGRKFMYKLRNLQYKDESFFTREKTRKSKPTNFLPSINLEFYDTKKTSLKHEKKENNSNLNKLQALTKKT